MNHGFKSFEYCLSSDTVNSETEFQLQSTGTNGVCITSLTVNGNQMLFGANNNLESFWIDENGEFCRGDAMSTSQLTIKNGQIQSSSCGAFVQRHFDNLQIDETQFRDTVQHSTINK